LARSEGTEFAGSEIGTAATVAVGEEGEFVGAISISYDPGVDGEVGATATEQWAFPTV